jgi:hypothetical protein
MFLLCSYACVLVISMSETLLGEYMVALADIFSVKLQV